MAITATRITATPPTATRPTAVQISAGGGGEVCRNVSNFNGVDSYAQFDNDIVLSGDFTVNVGLRVKQLGSTQVFIGDGVGSCFIAITTTGQVRVRIGNEDQYFNTYIGVNVDSFLTVSRKGFNVTVTDTSGNTQTITYSNTSNVLFEFIGKNNIGFYANAEIFNLYFDDNTAISLPMDESINEQTGNIDYINREGNTDYNATGYNITVTKKCSNKEVHVFVMGGQSNMVGWGSYDGLGDYSADVLQLTQDDILTRATSPLSNLDNQSDGMALTITFCNEYLASNPNVTLLLVQCAKGGTSFQNNEWGVGNTYYDIMKARTTKAMQSMSNTVLKGLHWHQGEFDDGNAVYETELDAQMNDYRSFCSQYTNDLPIILGQLAPSFVSTPSRQTIQDIITDTPNRLINTAIALSTDLTTFDNTHFDSASLRMLGERYYEQYNNVITNSYEWIDGYLYIDGQKWID